MNSSRPSLDTFLSQMWDDYLKLNPEALRVWKLFKDRGESVLNDHIALRTVNLPGWGVAHLAKSFEELGYQKKDSYIFTEKKLLAWHYEHSDPSQPKVFISELELEKMSSWTQTTLKNLFQKVSPQDQKDFWISTRGRLWDLDYETYLKLAEESEYASWVAAHGFRPNHFTVNINALKTFPSIQSLNQFLLENKVKMNTSGGMVKGSPDVLLEQSSTLASEIELPFSNGVFKVPGCYYEFAKRYALPNGNLYSGFVAASADKIFESTNRT